MAESILPNLKRLRTDRFLTQAQLGDALGVTSRTILRWENGDGEPGASELLALSKFFGVSIDQLLSDLFLGGATGPLPKVADLLGRQLDYWVARARRLPAHMTDDGPVIYEEGFGQRKVPSYSTDWEYGGPIIENRRIDLQAVASGAMLDGRRALVAGWIARCSDHSMAAWGPTALTAAMRAYLVAEIGPGVIS